MKVKLAEGNNEQGRFEFYLIGLEDYDEFPNICSVLGQSQHTRLIEQMDGPYSRIATFDDTVIGLFKVVYHEDVGTYAFSLAQSTEADNSLRDKLSQAILAISQTKAVQ